MLSLYVISTAAAITQICEELLPRIERSFQISSATLAGDSSGNTNSFNSQFRKILLSFKLNGRHRSQLSHIH